MSDFPRVIRGDHYEDFEELLRRLTSLGESGAVENPGQWYPVERFHRSSQQDKIVLGRAASVLIRDATHPGVVFLCTNMGPWNYKLWYPAAMDRLEKGPPFVGDNPTGNRTLLETVAETLCGGKMNEAMLLRARAILFDHAPLSSRMFFMASRGNQKELELVLSTYSQSESPRRGVLSLAISRLARMQLDREQASED